MRIAHLTATFPPYPGGAGNTAFRFAREQAERGHHVEVFTAPRGRRAAGSRARVVVHRIDPVFAIGNAPLIPSLARVEGFDVVHLHYPFIFGSELTLLGRLRRRRRGAGAARPLQEPARRQGAARAAVRGLRAHGRAGPDPRRRPRLRALAPTTRARSPTCAAPASASREKLIEMPNGVDAELFSPGDGGGAARAARDPRRRRRSPRSSPRSTAPITSSASTSRSTRSPGSATRRPPGGRRRRRAARRLPRPRRRGRGRRRAPTSSAPSPTPSCPRSSAPPTSSC